VRDRGINLRWPDDLPLSAGILRLHAEQRLGQSLYFFGLAHAPRTSGGGLRLRGWLFGQARPLRPQIENPVVCPQGDCVAVAAECGSLDALASAYGCKAFVQV